MVLPIIYDKGFEGNTKINRVINTFIGVKLNKGNNNIKLKFYPPLFKKSLYITISTIILMIICHFILLIYSNTRN